MSKHNRKFFPDIIENLPRADIPVEGLTAHLLQAERQQVVFMAFEKDVEIPEHSHEEQWGVVLEGRMDLTIAGEKMILQRGDSYFIPKDVKHSAVIYKGYKDLTFFNQKNRYELLK